MDGEKLRDLGLIFGAYEAMTARGAGPRDRLTRLAEKLRRFPFFQGQDVYLDGFTDFTPQQGLVLAELLRQAHSMTLALTYGEGGWGRRRSLPRRGKLWLGSRGWLPRWAVLWRRKLCPPGEWERTPPLRHLEQALFAHPMPSYTGPWDGSIVVHELPSPREGGGLGRRGDSGPGPAGPGSLPGHCGDGPVYGPLLGAAGGGVCPV